MPDLGHFIRSADGLKPFYGRRRVRKLCDHIDSLTAMLKVCRERESLTTDERDAIVLALAEVFPSELAASRLSARKYLMSQSGATDPAAIEQRARVMLVDVYRPEGVEIWLAGANRSFGGERPIDLIRRGDGERVLTRIQQLTDGNF